MDGINAITSWNIEDRDYTDTHRSESPLRKADDAIILDNADLSEKEQLEFAMELVRNILQGASN